MKRKLKIAGVLVILYGMMYTALQIWGGWFHIFDKTNMSHDRVTGWIASNGEWVIFFSVPVLFVLGLALWVGQVYKEEFRKKIYERIYLVLLTIGILATIVIAYISFGAQKPYSSALVKKSEFDQISMTYYGDTEVEFYEGILIDDKYMQEKIMDINNGMLGDITHTGAPIDIPRYRVQFMKEGEIIQEFTVDCGNMVCMRSWGNCIAEKDYYSELEGIYRQYMLKKE